ncbi:hypothetical protein AQPE_2509 [Aquipluma nitroreducens]|uniref:Uncharacterized protein n=1 Tax=Aquipluma nitroreducens TaxID=2010828 RepID=A0A5K7SA74_9BACT|nr:hypothetical protein AQPE_2509 [Aquipluma nitroreducens]
MQLRLFFSWYYWIKVDYKITKDETQIYQNDVSQRIIY